MKRLALLIIFGISITACAGKQVPTTPVAQYPQMTYNQTTATDVLLTYGSPVQVLGDYANPVYVYHNEEKNIVTILFFKERILVNSNIMTTNEFNMIV